MFDELRPLEEGAGKNDRNYPNARDYDAVCGGSGEVVNDWPDDSEISERRTNK